MPPTPALAMILAAAAPDPALLEKLGAQALAMEAFWNKAACTLDVSAEEKNGDGKVTRTVATSLRVARDGKNVTRKLLSHSEDGKDLTEQKRKELEGKEGSKVSKSPFHPTEQGKYRFSIDGSTIAFEPLGARTEDNLIGVAHVDLDAQTVKSLDMHPAKFPMFVQELAIRVEFDATTPGGGKGMSMLSVKGLAGALFFKKRFDIVTRFKDYEAL